MHGGVTSVWRLKITLIPCDHCQLSAPAVSYFPISIRYLLTTGALVLSPCCPLTMQRCMSVTVQALTTIRTHNSHRMCRPGACQGWCSIGGANCCEMKARECQGVDFEAFFPTRDRVLIDPQ